MTKEELLEKSSYLLIEYEDHFPILINLKTFKIENLPDVHIRPFYIEDKVIDTGTYTLLDKNKKILSIYEGYIPKMVPNEWGDYLNLDIDKNGNITNMYEIIVDEWIQK